LTFFIRFKQTVDFNLNVSRLIGLGCFSDPVQFQQYFLLLIILCSYNNLREIYNELSQRHVMHFRSKPGRAAAATVVILIGCNRTAQRPHS